MVAATVELGQFRADVCAKVLPDLLPAVQVRLGEHRVPVLGDETK